MTDLERYNPPARHEFYLDFSSNPIVLPEVEYTVVITHVRRISSETREYILFKHLVYLGNADNVQELPTVLKDTS